MSFTPSIQVQTVNNGTDLLVTDTSVYGSTLGSISKSAFVGRTVTLTRFDGITQVVLFPYSGTIDGVQDTVTVSGYFTGVLGSQTTLDLIVTVTVTYIYQVSGVNSSINTSIIYTSKYNTMNNLANLALSVYLSTAVGDTLSEQSNNYGNSFNYPGIITDKIKNVINNLEASKAKIYVGDLLTAQQLLTLACNLSFSSATC